MGEGCLPSLRLNFLESLENKCRECESVVGGGKRCLRGSWGSRKRLGGVIITRRGGSGKVLWVSVLSSLENEGGRFSEELWNTGARLGIGNQYAFVIEANASGFDNRPSGRDG